jgi:hypothetical protein
VDLHRLHPPKNPDAELTFRRAVRDLV